ncbi:hypothetical protein GCM10008018_26480 [Paenibacillus marchantiophytorum]|uniref:Xylose isomerase-like TIM barrel domain-containing protein n=1 Tax=Paenibacillus marchantiophytorum TaxID=1619310 RepID=A0ABQ1ENZ1_9BACL|nr:sugar phosphate isomerase/epimerase family protein [Paenibacillus marchantiophytorum]GFZ79646.1 hypothetical protein GCM10008018_26480 [Paenibacillus marchantiophytorum]
MRQLAFSTLPCEGWSLDKMIALAQTCGFNGMELREGPYWGISTVMTSEQREEAVRKFEKAGIRITNIGSSVILTGRPEDEAQFVDFQNVCSLASDLKACGIRIFLGYFTSRRDEPGPNIVYGDIVARIQQACDYAASCGVQVWIETHNEFATGRVLRKLLDDVNRPNCAVIYDIIHPLEEGESPEDTIVLLGSDCVHVHIKDGIPYEDPIETNWKYTKVGEGQIPIHEIIELLEKAGYSGSYSLEWESKWRKELQVPGMEPEIIFPSYTRMLSDIFQSMGK